MIVGLLSIFGAYGLAVAFVHLCRSWFGWSRLKPIYYVLVTRNNGLQIEWYLRSLLFFSWLKARTVKIVIMDERSDDDTIAIAEQLAAQRPEEIEVAVLGDSSQLDQVIARYENEEVVLVRLTGSQELQKLPLMQ